MNEKTLEVLTTLAEKLGTSAEYLWAVLVRQGPITGALHLVTGVLWVVAFVLAGRYLRARTKTPQPTEENPHPRAEWSDEVGVAFAWSIYGLLAILVFGVLSVELPDALSAIFNPEYWAFKQIFRR